MKKVALFLIKMIATLGLFIGLQQFIELKTRGFCLQKIQAHDLPFRKEWEILPLSSEQEYEINTLLSQPYTLLGAGSECFAFASADGKVVIKFFKLDFFRPVYLQQGLFLEDYSLFSGTLSDLSWTKRKCPPFLQQRIKRLLGIREFRIQRTFSSLKRAYDDLKEETGLLYLHLNPTSHLKRKLTLYDACGVYHEIDLDSTRFFLQKRAVPLEQHFIYLKKKHDETSAKASIDSLIKMILDRCKKGYADRDVLNRNLGFIGLKAIEIDSGSFLQNPRMKDPWVYKQELFYATLELKNWLKKNYPEMGIYLEDRVNEEIRTCLQQ